MGITVYVNPGKSLKRRADIFEEFEPEACLALKDDRQLFRQACEAAAEAKFDIIREPGGDDFEADWKRLLLATEFRNQWFREHLAAEAD